MATKSKQGKQGLCPRCGAPERIMVSAAGSMFWGCTDWPQCLGEARSVRLLEVNYQLSEDLARGTRPSTNWLNAARKLAFEEGADSYTPQVLQSRITEAGNHDLVEVDRLGKRIVNKESKVPAINLAPTSHESLVYRSAIPSQLCFDEQGRPLPLNSIAWRWAEPGDATTQGLYIRLVHTGENDWWWAISPCHTNDAQAFTREDIAAGVGQLVVPRAPHELTNRVFASRLEAEDFLSCFHRIRSERVVDEDGLRNKLLNSVWENMPTWRQPPEQRTAFLSWENTKMPRIHDQRIKDWLAAGQRIKDWHATNTDRPEMPDVGSGQIEARVDHTFTVLRAPNSTWNLFVEARKYPIGSDNGVVAWNAFRDSLSDEERKALVQDLQGPPDRVPDAETRAFIELLETKPLPAPLTQTKAKESHMANENITKAVEVVATTKKIGRTKKVAKDIGSVVAAAAVTAAKRRAALAAADGIVTIARSNLPKIGVPWPLFLDTPMGQKLARVGLPLVSLFVCKMLSERSSDDLAPALDSAMLRQVESVCALAVEGITEETVGEVIGMAMPMLSEMLALAGSSSVKAFQPSTPDPVLNASVEEEVE